MLHLCKLTMSEVVGAELMVKKKVVKQIELDRVGCLVFLINKAFTKKSVKQVHWKNTKSTKKMKTLSKQNLLIFCFAMVFLF